MTNLSSLEAIARAASPGPWTWREDYGSVSLNSEVNGPPTGILMAEPCAEQNSSVVVEPENADFIAAANPQTVLELIARVRELEAALVDLMPYLGRVQRLYNAMCGAMASWEAPDPCDPGLSDMDFERDGAARQAIRDEMRAVFDECPGVLFADREGDARIAQLRAIAAGKVTR